MGGAAIDTVVPSPPPLPRQSTPAIWLSDPETRAVWPMIPQPRVLPEPVTSMPPVGANMAPSKVCPDPERSTAREPVEVE